jgi:hypothetical protein
MNTGKKPSYEGILARDRAGALLALRAGVLGAVERGTGRARGAERGTGWLLGVKPSRVS